MKIELANDPYWTLKKWLDFVEVLIERHGEDAIMGCDGGYNNVELFIEKKEDEHVA